MGSFDLAVELRRSALDVGVAETLVFDVPVEPSLELTSVIGSDLADAEIRTVLQLTAWRRIEL